MIQGIITSLITMFVIWLLVKKYPTTIREDLNHLDQKFLAKKFRGLNFLYNLGFLLAIVVGALVIGELGVWIFKVSIGNETRIQFAIPISPWALYVGGGVLGLGLFSLFIFALIRRYIGVQDHAEFVTYLHRSQKMNVEKLNRHFGIGAIWLGIGISLFSSNTFTLFGDSGIKYSGFWDLGSNTYSYSEIEKIIWYDAFEAPNGNKVDREHFVIKFADGKSWNSRNQGYDEVERNEEIVDWLETRIAVEVDYQELNTD